MLHLPCRAAARRMCMRAGLPALALALVSAVPLVAFAAPPAAAAAAGKASKTSQAPAAKPLAPSGASRGNTGPGGKKVISLDDEFLVEGQLEKPSAFYVLRRSSTDYDWARVDATMTPLVLESVSDPLF